MGGVTGWYSFFLNLNNMARLDKGIMMKANIPHMVKLHPKQMEWLEWVFTTLPGRGFLDWCNLNEEAQEGFKWIWICEEYDKANDSGILNDIVGLYREWMYNEKRGLNKV
jgi:hypothetical protein